MNVLSLFDGMSCGRIALERAGIPVTNYYASEIDKYAIQVSKANYPDIIQLGSVTDVRAVDLPEIDLLIGGSPCQGFSFAGKQLNFEDPRSKLFFEFVRILNERRLVNPDVKFLLENVKMKKEYQDVISEALGVRPVFINSALFSAHNRQRFYWTNVKFDTPEDKKILLQDILESGVTDRDKSYCVDACYFKGGNLDQYFSKSRRQLVFKDYTALGAAQRGRSIVNGKRKDYLGAETEQRIEINGLPKSNCLTSVQKDTLVYQNNQIRKLTPIECERLQTVPDNYTECVSNSQRYKMLGNGWTIDVIAHIFKGLL